MVRYLASAERGRLFSISPLNDTFPPTSTIAQVDRTPEARLAVLRDLGYAFADFDLWDGWLILEESSAERIIRDYLIPWFAPKLARVRTLAVGGTGNVEPSFEDFQRMVRFTHLEQAYQGAVWVRVDGEPSGIAVVARMRASYASWPADRFSHFSQAEFERYYPAAFAARVDEVLALTNRQEKRTAKATLLSEVRTWLDEDASRGRASLAESAQEVIADLRIIETQLFASKA